MSTEPHLNKDREVDRFQNRRRRLLEKQPDEEDKPDRQHYPAEQDPKRDQRRISPTRTKQRNKALRQLHRFGCRQKRERIDLQATPPSPTDPRVRHHMRKPPPTAEITDIRPAGPDHQVISLTGCKATYHRRPCGTCPWRKDAVGVFPAEAFRHSAATAYDMSNHTFNCHTSGVTRPTICAGFLLNGSTHNLSIRIRLLQGTLDLNAVHDGGHDLFASYRAMAIANGVSEDEPIIKPCREE
jgi:hypothetical protein